MSERVLGDLADLTVGHVGSMASEYVDTGIPFLRSLNVRPFRIDLDGVKNISQDFHHRLAKSALKPGDVVVVRTGAPGTAAVIPDSIPLANCSDVVIVRPGPDLDSRYLAYLINSVARGYIDSRTVGAVQQHFNVGAARGIPIPAATLAEQRRIAGVLGALDDLIETNRQAIKSMERQAQAIFELSLAHSGPAEVVTLSNLVERGQLVLSDGYRTRGDQLSKSGIPILRVADVLDGEISASYNDRILESMRPRMGVKVSEVHDILITTKGTVGRIALVPPGLPEHAYSPQVCFLRVIDRAAFTPAWLYCWARSPEFTRQIGIVKDQTDMAPYVSLTDLRRVKMTLPSTAKRRVAEAQLAPLTAAIEAFRQEIADLTTTRDELLPLLMSGKLQVSDDLVLA